MAKVTIIPKQQRGPSHRGRVMIDTFRGVVRIRKWPKKRGPPKSEAQRFWVDWFKQANHLAKYADPLTQIAAIELTRGTGWYPRDVILKAMRGRLYWFTGADGWRYYPMAAIGDISEALDVLAQSVGSVLVRAADRWRTPDPGSINDVLTLIGTPAIPIWKAPTGGGGFSGGALVTRLSNLAVAASTTVMVPFDSELYDTDGIHDNVTNPSRLTVPTGTTWIRLTGNVRWNASMSCGLDFRKNGAWSPGIGYASIDKARGIQTMSPILAVVAGDYFELAAANGTSASKTILQDTDIPSFSMALL